MPSRITAMAERTAAHRHNPWQTYSCAIRVPFLQIFRPVAAESIDAAPCFTIARAVFELLRYLHAENRVKIKADLELAIAFRTFDLVVIFWGHLPIVGVFNLVAAVWASIVASHHAPLSMRAARRSSHACKNRPSKNDIGTAAMRLWMSSRSFSRPSGSRWVRAKLGQLQLFVALE